MNAEALLARGFFEIRPSVFVRVKTRGNHVSGLAIWRHEETLLFAGAKMALADARALVMRLCRQLSSRVPKSKRNKARKVLSALLAKNLQVSGRRDPDVRDIELVVEALDELAVSGFGDRLKKAFRRVKDGINRLAKKVAHNKVMKKLRAGYAKVVEGPAGKVTAKAVGKVLQAYGVPSVVTERAIRAHHARVASRLRDGGWAGVAARATGQGGLRGAAKTEARRFGRGWKQSLRERGTSRGRGLDLDRIARMAQRIGAVDDEWVEDPWDETAWDEDAWVEGEAEEEPRCTTCRR